MSALPPRLALAGSHVAAGLLVADRARALALFTSGAVLHVIEDRVLVLFPTPRRLLADEAPGALVVDEGGVLATLPLSSALRVALDAPAGSLVEARGGALVVHAIGSRSLVDPADWIEIDGIELLRASPLGPTPEPAAAPPNAAAEDARSAIGPAIPEAAAGVRAMAEALRGVARGRPGDPALPPAGPSSIGSLFARVRDLLSRGAASDAAQLARRGPSVLARLRAWLARSLLRTRLSRYVARRQAEYLARMLDLFERGDVREALRWAIPLGGEDDGGTPSLGMLRPRDSLALAMHRAPATSTIGFTGLYDLLRERYLRVLEQLKAKGMVDEAAFVLAELLDDPAGAVALLERHGRHAQAARLAEARNLDAATQVRLWVIARDLPRALTIARRHDAFAAAITILRSRDPNAASVLALEWANLLAESGDLVAAVDAAKDVPAATALVRAWVERALDVGGRAGALMLARRIGLSPDRFDDSCARVLALMQDSSAERATERATFARALLEAERTPEVAAVAAPTLRALWRDGPLERHDDVPRRLAKLVDGALRADRPPLPPAPKPERLADRTSPRLIGVRARDTGSIAVRDVVLLPSGRTLVALGEAGVRLLARDGRTVATFDVPADALVIGDHGTRAIAIARRGELHRVARLDVLGRRAQPWWEARLTSYARTFDGASWLVSEAGVATVIDAIADGWRCSWRLDGERCVHVERTGPQSILLVSGDELSRWTYDSPSMRLRQRNALELEGAGVEHPTIVCAPEVWSFGRQITPGVGEGLARLAALERPRAWLMDGAPIPGTLRAGALHACAATRLSAGIRLDVVLTEEALRPVLGVMLDGATECCTRIDGGLLTVGDDRGRALAIDLETGALLRDLRVRA